VARSSRTDSAGQPWQPNKEMKLTKLSAAPLRGRSAASCPNRSTSNAGTASQIIPLFDGRQKGSETACGDMT
jgi:hypothetical protein